MCFLGMVSGKSKIRDKEKFSTLYDSLLLHGDEALVRSPKSTGLDSYHIGLQQLYLISDDVPRSL